MLTPHELSEAIESAKRFRDDLALAVKLAKTLPRPPSSRERQLAALASGRATQHDRAMSKEARREMSRLCMARLRASRRDINAQV